MIDKLFEAMRNDMETMSEYGDDETALKRELLTADESIIDAYINVFLKED